MPYLSYLLIVLLSISIVVVYRLLRRESSSPPSPPPSEPPSWDFEAPSPTEQPKVKKHVSMSLLSTVRVFTPNNITERDVITMSPQTQLVALATAAAAETH
jgi:hypothetical protein